MSGRIGCVRGQRYYLYEKELERPIRSSTFTRLPSSYYPKSKLTGKRRSTSVSRVSRNYKKSSPPPTTKRKVTTASEEESPQRSSSPPSKSTRKSHVSRGRSRKEINYEKVKMKDVEKSRSKNKSRTVSAVRSQSSPACSSPSPEKEKEYDLSIPLKPLIDFVHEPRRLLKEAMTLLGAKKLNAMIPPSLKTVGRRNLEFFCLEELERLDSKSLRNILEGKNTKRDSTHNQTEETQRSQSPSSSRSKKYHLNETNTGKDTSGDLAAVKKFKTKLKKVLIQETDSKKHKKKKKRSKADHVDLSDGRSVEKRIKKHKKKSKKKRKSDEVSSTAATDFAAVPGQRTLMELLELEYRAKAIKALLRTQGLDASRIDSALSLDAPPLSPAEPVPVLADEKLLPDADSNENTEGNGNGAPPTQSQNQSPVIRSPDSSNVVTLLTDPDEGEGYIEIVESESPISSQFSSPRSVEINESPQNSSPDHVTSSITNIDVDAGEEEEENEIVYEDEEVQQDIEWSPHEVQTEEEEDKERSELEFVLKVKRSDKLDDVASVDDDLVVIKISSPPSAPVPKEIEEGEIDSDAEEAKIIAYDLPLVGGVDDSSDEESMRVYRKRPSPLPSKFSDSESECSSPEKKRRTWTRFRSRQRKSPSGDNGALSDVSLMDLEDSNPEEKEKVKLTNTGKEIDEEREDIESLPDDALERISSEGEDGAASSPLGKSDEDDFYDLPVIKEDGSVLFPRTASNDSSDNDNKSNELNFTPTEKAEYQDEDEDTPLTWYHRWYKSKKTQRIVKANKVYGSLRSKLRREKALPNFPPKKVDPSVASIVSEPEVSIPIIGSIEEYEKLFGKVEKRELAAEVRKENLEEAAEETVLSSDDEGEDDDLWGDIMGQNS